MSSVITTTPPLVDGERLDREEFHRRYLAMPHVKKAELIDGVVHMGSPVRTDVHGSPHFLMNGWLCSYVFHTPCLIGSNSGTVRLTGDNVFQPDVFLMVDRTRGGHASLEPDGYVTGGPELAVEVSASTLSKDRNAKFRNYRDSGVREYVLWRVGDGMIDWFILRDGKYEALPLSEGVYKSEVFPGLWLDPAALLRADGIAVLTTLQQGIASPEHEAFVEKLRRS